MIAVSALGAAAIGATLALFFVANARLKSANTASARSATVSAAAFDVRAAVVSIDQALQGVVEQYDAKLAGAMALRRAVVGGARSCARARCVGEQRPAAAARARAA